MTFLPVDEEWKRGRPRRAFGSRLEVDAWMAEWCDTCLFEADCPLLAVAEQGRTPAVWKEIDLSQLGNQYECGEWVKFR